ncbi:hypothetical protein [uncultured Kocuria sp.]|uniref:hypothetical protein n=1 Tax=uncultured Kocuria sp. TaxID=259305 RepID=UPI0025938538|nr:hypothetical protein [uncultured Kocuria sp.]MCT1366509.1 hypothetical protein [Rothia sp. p3-SID1597]
MDVSERWIVSIDQVQEPHMEHTQLSRRDIAKGAAWSAPLVAATAAIPAYAASPTNPDLAVLFDGGGGSDGYFNSAYLNLGVPASDTPITTQAPITMVIDVVGLNPNATDERSMTFGSSFGSVSRSSYNSSTFTTTITWTIPENTQLPVAKRGSGAVNVLFTFRDGASSKGRITNKIIIRSVSGGTIVSPQTVPIDSSVVRDANQGAVSPNGIY